MPSVQARYWLLTIPWIHYPREPKLDGSLVYLKGQRELGRGGLDHWQFLAVFSKKVTLSAVKLLFCKEAHAEPSRSDAANEYVWKKIHVCLTHSSSMGPCPFQEPAKPIGTKSNQTPKLESSTTSPLISSSVITEISRDSEWTQSYLTSDQQSRSTCSGSLWDWED